MKEALEHKNVLWTETVQREPAETVGIGSCDVHALRKLSVIVTTLMRMIVVCAKACFLPTVKAAPPPNDPPKPAPMKYTDLPLYDCPHVAYKDLVDGKQAKCPDTKILQAMLLPHVSKYRKQACEIVCKMKSQVLGVCCCTRKGLDASFQQTKAYCRSADNDNQRKAIMATAPIVGGLVACGGKPTRLFGATAAAAAAGALCYPEPTDKVFKSVLKCAAGQAIILFNFACSGNFALKRLVCPMDYPDMPKPPPKPMDNKCATKK